MGNRSRLRRVRRWSPDGGFGVDDPVRPAQPMPRFAALVIDVAVAYAVFVVTASARLSDNAAGAVIVALPVLIVVWEAAWLRLTGATVGHWLTSIGLVWPGGRPGFLRLCWRTVKRYALFWMIAGQPSNVAPGALGVETVRPIAFSRVSRLIDGDAVVAARPWSVGVTAAVFALCLAVPLVGVAAAVGLEPPAQCEEIATGRAVPRSEASAAEAAEGSATVALRYDCDAHELRAPLLAASLAWLAGAVFSLISVIDAGQNRRRSAVAVAG
jgi:hypothetical protein